MGKLAKGKAAKIGLAAAGILVVLAVVVVALQSQKTEKPPTTTVDVAGEMAMDRQSESPEDGFSPPNVVEAASQSDQPEGNPGLMPQPDLQQIAGGSILGLADHQDDLPISSRTSFFPKVKDAPSKIGVVAEERGATSAMTVMLRHPETTRGLTPEDLAVENPPPPLLAVENEMADKFKSVTTPLPIPVDPPAENEQFSVAMTAPVAVPKIPEDASAPVEPPAVPALLKLPSEPRSPMTTGFTLLGRASGPVPEPDRRYTIQPNDNLWLISQKLYGDGRYFKALWKYNENSLPRPDLLKIGDVVMAPALTVLKIRHPDLYPATWHNRFVAVSSAADHSYTAKQGDTLFDIAQSQLGDGSRWVEVYELNRDSLTAEFAAIKPGTQLVLPPAQERHALTKPPGTTTHR